MPVEEETRTIPASACPGWTRERENNCWMHWLRRYQENVIRR